MPPKKDAKKDGKDKDKKPDDVETKFLEEIKVLENARNDMMVEHTVLSDKFRQLRSENDVLKAELAELKGRLAAATDDYSDILEHRQEQIKTEESKLKQLGQNVERLEQEIARNLEEIKALKDLNTAQASRLSDASQMLTDKEILEDAVRKQHDLIEKQSEELKNLKKQIDEKDTTIGNNRNQIEELTLKASGETELKILFDEPWLVQTSHCRLKGELPNDREDNTLSALSGGKLLVMYGGHSRSAMSAHDKDLGKEVVVLNIDSMLWEKPSSARTVMPHHSHNATVVGRTKIFVFGGVRNDVATNEVAVFNTDTMKWTSPVVKGVVKPMARHGHACACIREKVFVFGGVNEQSELLNDLWFLDQDTLQWQQVMFFGVPPSPRRGATLSATEDGRRLYVVGGNDGTKVLNDVHCLETEKLTWIPMMIQGGSPEGREDHTAMILSRYLFISGGSGAGGIRRLTDSHVLDMYNGPKWEMLDAGAWGNNMMWLKTRSAYNTFYGNKLFTIKPNVHEKIWEIQVIEFALPEDIERLRHSKKKEKDHAERLELMDDAICTTNSIELGWRPPTKNAERIDKYKLMIATNTGVVKEAYMGRGSKFKVLGLKPNTEYIFCVKAIYDDGSFLWSESKAYHTKS